MNSTTKGTLAVEEKRNITFRAIPTGQLFSALMEGRYVKGTHDYPSVALHAGRTA
ncbi:hypothetical protein [Tunturiibacter gelidiferens]|uniref:hypothetical protein n=1 Tax=Tunturiibacter gelidiferens TaxID=3069689 RepID=UPI003D9BD199